MNIKRFLTLGFSGAAALLAGCSSSFTSPATTALNLPPAAPDQGLVVFYRPQNLLDTGNTYLITEDDVVVGQLSNQTYLLLGATPGTHTFAISKRGFSTKVIQVEAGKTYFMEAIQESDHSAGQPTLRMAMDADATTELPHLRNVLQGWPAPSADLAQGLAMGTNETR